MPCKQCGKKVACGNNVWYCKCGRCNFCHKGGVNNNAKIIGPHWFAKANSNEKINPFVPGQSHGGHSFVPLYTKIHK